MNKILLTLTLILASGCTPTESIKSSYYEAYIEGGLINYAKLPSFTKNTSDQFMAYMGNNWSTAKCDSVQSCYNYGYNISTGNDYDSI